jgi:hypothetical protein
VHPTKTLFALLLLVPVAACSGTSKGPGTTNPYQTEAEFCAAWASAACNATVVQECAATDAQACKTAQAAFCEQLLPGSGYNSENAKQCIEQVKSDYKDGKLTRSDYETVRDLGAPCDTLIQGPGQAGDSCNDRNDCDTLQGLDCVFAAASPGDAGAEAGPSSSGTCEVPNIVNPGEDCSGPGDECASGYYCGGGNPPHCIASGKVGAACSDTLPCGSGLNCQTGRCISKSGQNGPCASNADCQDDLLCATAGGNTGVCIAEDTLGPTDPVCLDLR